MFKLGMVLREKKKKWTNKYIKIMMAHLQKKKKKERKKVKAIRNKLRYFWFSVINKKREK
jgi:hypothetical protein